MAVADHRRMRTVLSLQRHLLPESLSSRNAEQIESKMTVKMREEKRSNKKNKSKRRKRRRRSENYNSNSETA